MQVNLETVEVAVETVAVGDVADEPHDKLSVEL